MESTSHQGANLSQVEQCRTYLLVHGAYHGGWCWKNVAARLRARGHLVYTPTLTGLGERSHLMAYDPTLETFIQDVEQVLRYEDLEDVILVGHSFAGLVISGVADRMKPYLRHLVFLDAAVLFSGESSADRAPERAEAYRQRAIDDGTDTSIPPGPPEHFGVTDPAMAAWLKTKLTAHPLQTYYDKLVLNNPVGNGLPATYIACADPFFAATERSRAIAREMPGWRYLELPTAHDAMLLMPDELTDMLLSAV